MKEQEMPDNATDLDFVFIDNDSKPFRVRKMDGEYWLCFLHPDKHWVARRKIESSPELWHMQNACIDWEHHKLYEFGISFQPDGKGWPSYDSPQFRSNKPAESTESL